MTADKFSFLNTLKTPKTLFIYGGSLALFLLFSFKALAQQEQEICVTQPSEEKIIQVSSAIQTSFGLFKVPNYEEAVKAFDGLPVGSNLYWPHKNHAGSFGFLKKTNNDKTLPAPLVVSADKKIVSNGITLADNRDKGLKKILKMDPGSIIVWKNKSMPGLGFIEKKADGSVNSKPSILQ